MKSTTLGLALSTVAFGASSIYLWNQLAGELEQVAAVQKANRDLNARIVELEKRRTEIAESRMGRPGTFEGAAMAHARPGPEPGPPPLEDDKVFSAVRQGPGNRPPDMPAAMLKMMRADVRAQNKRMYFDLQSKLGLTDEQSDALLDLLTEQQTQGFRDLDLDPEQARDVWDREQQKRRSDIADLLGYTKAEQFEDYQKSMPSRSELSMLAQQLENAEVPITNDQRSKMLSALEEERERIPIRTYAEGTAREEMVKGYEEWQSDYERRLTERARTILSSEQLGTYSEYAQWQKEVREQLAADMPPMRENAEASPPAYMFSTATFGTTSESTTHSTDEQSTSK